MKMFMVALARGGSHHAVLPLHRPTILAYVIRSRFRMSRSLRRPHRKYCSSISWRHCTARTAHGKVSSAAHRPGPDRKELDLVPNRNIARGLAVLLHLPASLQASGKSPTLCTGCSSGVLKAAAHRRWQRCRKIGSRRPASPSRQTPKLRVNISLKSVSGRSVRLIASLMAVAERVYSLRFTLRPNSSRKPQATSGSSLPPPVM